MKIANKTKKIFFIFLVLPLLSGSYSIPRLLDNKTNTIDSCAVTCAGKSTISRAALIMQAAAPAIEKNKNNTDTARFIPPNGDNVWHKK